MAASRSPATEDLHLEAAGVATDERGYITVDDQLRTNPDSTDHWSRVVNAVPSNFSAPGSTTAAVNHHGRRLCPYRRPWVRGTP